MKLKVKKLLDKGHLIPIYNALGETLCLVGYQRKPTSRKAHQRPFILKQPIVVGKIPTNPEPEVACDSPERSQNNINEQ